MKKYELTSEFIIVASGIKLYRIKALISFANIEAGDLGGFIEKEENLNQHGDAWVYGDARVYGNARVFGDADVYGNAWVFGDARVYGDSESLHLTMLLKLQLVFLLLWLSIILLLLMLDRLVRLKQ